jgi:outer membrane protein TolC
VALADAAWAERWPVLNLGASVSYQATRIDRLITPQALVGEVVGGLLAPLFDGGRRRAAQAVAEAEAGAVSQVYRQVVAEAWQETRSALAAAMTSAVGELSATQHAANAEANADRVTADWQAGLVTTPDLYASRRLALEARVFASTARHRAWRDWLTVQRALALPPMLHQEVRP